MSSPSPRRFLFFLVLAGLAPACYPPAQGNVTGISVMTQDLGVGGDLDAVLAAAPADQPALADALWAQKDTASFAKRATALAAGVALRSPDVLGVQSALQWRRTPPASGAETLVADYLDLLVAALASSGLSYVPVSTTTTAELSLTGAGGDVYRLTDREVLLVRAGTAASGVTGGAFLAQRAVSVGGSTVPYPRGWASALVQIGGKTFQAVTTHLDSVDRAVQQAQAKELLRIASGPAVVMGNLGADVRDPGWAAYGLMTAVTTGYSDSVSNAGAAFPTCCRDAACVDPRAGLDRRQDVILTSQEFQAWTGARVGGGDAATTMVDGLWPSPHAGVSAGLLLP